MRRRQQRGFSLYELLITVSVASVLSFGATGMYSVVQNQQVTTEINQLLGHLALARSEAVKRRQNVVLCPSTDNVQCAAASDYTWWHSGVLLFVDANENGRVDGDETPIRIFSPAANNVRVKSSRFRSRVVYQPNGLASGTTATFTFCDRRNASKPRYVVISNTGRARVSALPPDGRADDGLERCS